MMNGRSRRMVQILCLAAAHAACGAALADWLNWRGPYQDGSTRAPATVTSWSHTGENLRWKADVGGRTTPIIHDGRVYVIAPAGSGETLGERVVALDAETGKQIWEFVFSAFHTDIVENRVGWTALAVDGETGNIYAHTTGGELLCLSRDGKLVWKRSLLEEFGRFSGYGGRLHTPVIDEERVILSIVNMNWGPDTPMGHRYFALDKKTGALLWWSQPGGRPLDTTYAWPVVAVIDGKRLLIAPNADGYVYAMLSRTGDVVWKYQLSARPLNSPPIVDGSRVFLSHGEENTDTTVMGRVVCLDVAGASGELDRSREKWRVDGIESRFPAMAHNNGRLYVLDDSANLVALQADNGQQLWTHSIGRVARGGPVVTADGVIYAAEANGHFVVLKDTGTGCEVLDDEALPRVDDAVNELFATPSVCKGRVYFMSRYGLYCLGPAEPGADLAVAKLPDEKPADDKNPKKLLVVPGDVTVAPGAKIPLQLKIYDANGVAIPPTIDDTPKWSLAGVPGKISGTTVEVDPKASFAAGLVKVTWAGLEGSARVRVIPPLPITEDFEQRDPNSAPPGWQNVAGKAQVVERDGGKALMHLAQRPTPTFMRLRTFFTDSIAGGYTISADMLGTFKKPHWKPDMGLVNSRYEMILVGTEPTLRLTTWPALPRLQKDVPFEWQPDKWYRMKLDVRFDGGKGLIRGKVWPRDEQEPSAWTIELTDPAPTMEGAAALYGYAAGTTASKPGCNIYWDNVRVEK